MSILNKTVIAGLAAGITLSFGTTAISAASMNFEGKRIKIVIPYGPGGTYDKYGVAF
jgi:tripartite-type tricarboxylate transporter receptor subunit TctC